MLYLSMAYLLGYVCLKGLCNDKRQQLAHVAAILHSTGSP